MQGQKFLYIYFIAIQQIIFLKNYSQLGNGQNKVGFFCQFAKVYDLADTYLFVCDKKNTPE